MKGLQRWGVLSVEGEQKKWDQGREWEIMNGLEERNNFLIHYFHIWNSKRIFSEVE